MLATTVQYDVENEIHWYELSFITCPSKLSKQDPFLQSLATKVTLRLKTLQQLKDDGINIQLSDHGKHLHLHQVLLIMFLFYYSPLKHWKNILPRFFLLLTILRLLIVHLAHTATGSSLHCYHLLVRMSLIGVQWLYSSALCSQGHLRFFQQHS